MTFKNVLAKPEKKALKRKKDSSLTREQEEMITDDFNFQ